MEQHILQIKTVAEVVGHLKQETQMGLVKEGTVLFHQLQAHR
jgi:hypothetical protein